MHVQNVTKHQCGKMAGHGHVHPRSFATDGVGDPSRCGSSLPRFTLPAPARVMLAPIASPMKPLPSMTLSSLHDRHHKGKISITRAAAIMGATAGGSAQRVRREPILLDEVGGVGLEQRLPFVAAGHRAAAAK